MKKVYRVQHKKDGRGPYRPCFTVKWIDDDRGESDRPPHWMEFGDFLGRIPLRFSAGSGFKDLDQLREWFSDRELSKLKELGFIIVKLKVNSIIEESDKQLVFASSKHLTDCIVEIINIRGV